MGLGTLDGILMREDLPGYEGETVPIEQQNATIGEYFEKNPKLIVRSWEQT